MEALAGKRGWTACQKKSLHNEILKKTNVRAEMDATKLYITQYY